MTFRAVFAFAALALVGCDNAAVVQVQLQNETHAASSARAALSAPPLASLATSAPSRFALRLRRVYLAEGVKENTQTNTGRTAVVWQNVACAGGGVGALNTDHCPFVDLAGTTIPLASEPVIAHSGTYAFARLEICKSSPTEANVEWSGSDMSAPKQAMHGWCQLTSAKIDPPVQLDVGESLTIALTYDLSSTIESGPADTFADSIDAFDCTTNGATRSCARMPTITVAVTKN